MLRTTLAATAAFAGFVAAPASAAPYSFTITGSYTASFTLLSSTPSASNGTTAGYYFVDGVFPGATPGDEIDVYFFTAGLGGGLEIDDYDADLLLLSTDGAQLFTGTPAAPTFLTGTFPLTQYMGSGTYSLTVTDLGAPAVPEPASWAMLMLGLGMIGGVMRYRAKVSRVTYA